MYLNILYVIPSPSLRVLIYSQALDHFFLHLSFHLTSPLYVHRDPEAARKHAAADQMHELRHAMLDERDARRLSIQMRVVITGHVGA
jgi:hypothetical protein